MKNIDSEIRNEIIGIAPILANISKVGTPEIPKDYFYEVESQVLAQLMLLQETESNTAKVPEGYFSEVEATLLKTLNQPEKGGKIISMTERVRRSFMKYAAVVLFVTAGLFAINHYVTQSSKSAATTELTQDDYLIYINDNIDDFDVNVMIDNGLVAESDVQGIAGLDLDVDINDFDIFE